MTGRTKTTRSSIKVASSELRAAELILLTGELPAGLADSHLARAAAELGHDLEAPSPSESRADRLGRLRSLRDLLETQRREVAPEQLRARNLGWWTFALALVVVPAATYAALEFATSKPRPWRATYYPSMDFSETPVVYWENDLNHDWQELSPVDEMPPNRFSARFETCLVLDAPTELRFELTSDDGSRLFIDGERVVRNWGVHASRTRTGTIRLEPGPHSLEVQYFERVRSASIVLEVSIDGGANGRLPVELLRAPGEDSPPGQACDA